MTAIPFKALPLWACVAIEWMAADSALRTEAKRDNLLEHFAAHSGGVVDDATRESARQHCRRRFMTSYSEPALHEYVPPGSLRLARLYHDDGALHHGDMVATAARGECEVVRVHGPQAIEVCEASTGQHYLLCGSDFGAAIQAGADLAKGESP
jgi:hypothetical protein